MRRLLFGFGLAQIVTCAALIALAAGRLGQPPLAAAVIGLAFSLSSTALIIPVLAEHKALGGPAGRATLAALLAQDLAVAPILVTLGLVAGLHGGGAWTGALVPFATAAAALLGLIVGGRLLLRPLFHSAAQAKSPDMFIAASLLIVVGSAAAAAAGGLSMAVGGFVAGLLLAETEFRREVEVVAEPFRGLLLGMFFITVGAGLDIERLVSEPLVVLGVTAGVIALKGGAIFALARLLRQRMRPAAAIAASLSTPGEFAFVLVAQALAGGLIGADAGQAVIVSAGLGLFLAPPLTAAAARIAAHRGAPAPATLDPLPAGVAATSPQVLVVGYGRVGRLVGEMLGLHDIAFTAIDADPGVAAAGRAAGVRLYFGDAARESFLKACGVETAPAVVVTMDAPAKVDEVVRTVRSLRPDVTLIARARDARHAEGLYRLGVTDAVPEAIEASLQLAENTLVDLGVPMGLVIASIHEKRDELRRLFSQSAARPAPVRAFRLDLRHRRPDRAPT
jgi:CPA2 family monovalent cation:H+ antiporter-2